MIARKKPKHWPKDAIHLYIWDFLPQQYNIHICKIKTETIIHKTLKTNSTLDYCSMGSGEQGNQISSKSRSFQCKIYESAQFPSTSSRVKCLFFRRAKELNRRCQCDVNLKKLVLRLSLFFPRTRLSTFRLTESLAGCLNNDDSDGNVNGNGKRAI